MVKEPLVRQSGKCKFDAPRARGLPGAEARPGWGWRTVGGKGSLRAVPRPGLLAQVALSGSPGPLSRARPLARGGARPGLPCPRFVTPVAPTAPHPQAGETASREPASGARSCDPQLEPSGGGGASGAHAPCAAGARRCACAVRGPAPPPRRPGSEPAGRVGMVLRCQVRLGTLPGARPHCAPPQAGPLPAGPGAAAAPPGLGALPGPGPSPAP